ncbi:MAG: sulfatase-like hydrolase/transferase, partial [Myxococcota bacterium]
MLPAVSGTGRGITGRTTRRDFLRAIAALALASRTGRAGAAPASGRGSRPNVLLILADDLGQECLSAYGGSSYETPHLDRLAAGGMVFRHGFSTPLCGPSRIELLTGRYIRGYREWGELDPGHEVTFGQLLRDAGYATAVAGKWQLCRFDLPENADHPQRCGFQESSLWTWILNGETPSKYWSPSVWRNGSLAPDLEGAYGPDVFCDFLIDFIRRSRREPFLAFYPMVLPHGPFTPTPHSGLPARLLGVAPQRVRNQASSLYFPDHLRYLDHLVGRLLATLEESGLLENTLVLFTSDNGTDRRVQSRVDDREVRGGKGRLSEPGTLVPLFASWPGQIQPGTVCTDLVDLSDFLPTLAAVARAEIPDDLKLDGRSFLPQLLGRPGDPRDWVYLSNWVYPNGPFQVAARGRRFKLHGDG